MGDIKANKDLEVTKLWDDLSDFERECIIVSHAQHFRKGGVRVTDERMKRILELGRPKCVFAYKGEEIQYYRVHKDSTDVMKVLFNNYLEKTVLEEIEEEFPDMLEDLE